MGSITVTYRELASTQDALSTFDEALWPLVKMCSNEAVCDVLTDEERAIVKDSVEALLGIVNHIADDLALVSKHGVHAEAGLTFDPEVAAFIEDSYGEPCPGTCYECTKQDADEFWSGPAFFPAVV